MKINNKRFLVACVGIIFSSITICILSYRLPSENVIQLADIYKWILGSITVSFFGVQTFSDNKKLGGVNGDS